MRFYPGMSYTHIHIALRFRFIWPSDCNCDGAQVRNDLEEKFFARLSDLGTARTVWRGTFDGSDT